MKDKEVEGIINELQTMLLRGAPRSAAEAAKERQRLDEIEAVLNAKASKVVPHMRGVFDAITRRKQ